jgi:hypothetical protein
MQPRHDRVTAPAYEHAAAAVVGMWVGGGWGQSDWTGGGEGVDRVGTRTQLLPTTAITAITAIHHHHHTTRTLPTKTGALLWTTHHGPSENRSVVFPELRMVRKGPTHSRPHTIPQAPYPIPHTPGPITQAPGPTHPSP